MAHERVDSDDLPTLERPQRRSPSVLRRQELHRRHARMKIHGRPKTLAAFCLFRPGHVLAFLFGLGIMLLQRLVKLESARRRGGALENRRKSPERVAPGLPTLSCASWKCSIPPVRFLREERLQIVEEFDLDALTLMMMPAAGSTACCSRPSRSRDRPGTMPA